LTPVTREELILPDEIRAAIERTTMGFTEHAGQLVKAGRHVKRGLLFHGPPGTGKSHTLRYLVGAMPGRTTIVLTGAVLGLIKPSCELARALAPSTVILEDVDLIAEDRQREPQCGPLLFELMNEMDGLPGDADVIFLLTTNRPDILEPALASRPGRIDQAIEFPLPDETCRRQLFELYSRGLDVEAAAVDDMVGRTDGASPAFIRELIRRAALNAAIRDGAGDTLRVDLNDLVRALDELLVTGGKLTGKLLGVGRGKLSST
ncbi:MAG: AAA family ATPase, partial [Tepidiformaceae bacterium]